MRFKPNTRFVLLRLALRDFRGGFSGFFIFLACLALGVAAITGVGAIAHSLSDGLAQKGRVILGGDMSFELALREATPKERAVLAAQGKIAPIALMRAMARTPARPIRARRDQGGRWHLSR